jgi:uncharacterized protein
LDAKTLIDGNEIFGQYKGALTEQYVLQQFKSIDDLAAFYWTPEEGIAKIDFLIQISGLVIPIEVKANENLKAKSLRSFRDKYKPKVSVRASMSDYREEPTMTNIPLYAIGQLNEIITELTGN